MELSIYNIKGEDTGRKVQLNDAVFGIEPNDHAIYLDVKQYLANRRQGTHKSKQRSEIAGSTRKLGRQKGGGGARPGDIKSPVRVGGGRIFGPVPRDYSFKLNKKVKQLARKSALSLRAKNEQIIVLEGLNFETPKTQSFVQLMNNLKIADKKSLFVLPVENKVVYLSARNLQNANVVTVSELNTYRIMDSKVVVVSEETIAAIEQTFNA
ncbi:MAG: 50S ribosomal protein L4 [Paludibacter sp.]|nr:50S ribosomal protein L4 [Bacteroidales bacterium]MCM1068274.1 50S ribosomal protein L4 [Prevotella sp.]MCM1354623.1 50S ribosomal protein L4 [Bacteroides sp.]MCM1442059.1 50S ribosomal protein L4 [Muribaculum sp.]MCM1482047.1 50S ribosomal protein L4 [Paludibacter sp.]